MRQYGGDEKGPRNVHGHGYLTNNTACLEENQSKREISSDETVQEHYRSYIKFEQFHGHKPYKPYRQFAISFKINNLCVTIPRFIGIC